MKKILIIDTKAGNLFSLKAAIERLGFNVTILQQPNTENYDAIVIPGQGRFGTVMENIQANGWVEYLNQFKGSTTPIFGICVGMQIFFNASEEDPEAVGLGWLNGKAQALDFPKKPMVGWSTLKDNVWNDTIVYFVNSYAIKDSPYSIATTTYGENFCAAVKLDNFIGVQFHPEKSSEAGSQIINQILTQGI
ncbi:imidazole glycerol phosphate synthase subunit HisH [Aliikangiella maris]|uniref:Imidazole glycerol phosphate synthase subunit HisH n=2 Tax=Aliikangiella maris TaxID=3162458 RepID=A0ABV2BVC7_9GAMM